MLPTRNDFLEEEHTHTTGRYIKILVYLAKRKGKLDGNHKDRLLWGECDDCPIAVRNRNVVMDNTTEVPLGIYIVILIFAPYCYSRYNIIILCYTKYAVYNVCAIFK